MALNSRTIAKPGGGQLIRAQLIKTGAEFTRPANTTAYTAGDVVGTDAAAESAIDFSVTQVPGGAGYIVGATLWTSQAANVAEYSLYLFTAGTSTLTIPFDNAAYTTLYAERDYFVGKIVFPAAADATGGGSNTAAISEVQAISLPFDVASGGLSLYGVLVTETGFTPDSGQTFAVRLMVEPQ